MTRGKSRGGGSKGQGRMTTVRLDADADAALRVLVDRGRVSCSQAIREALVAAATGPDRLDEALAALTRIEARLAGGVSVKEGGESAGGACPLREGLAALAAIVGEDHWGDDVVTAVRSIRSDDE